MLCIVFKCSKSSEEQVKLLSLGSLLGYVCPIKTKPWSFLACKNLIQQDCVSQLYLQMAMLENEELFFELATDYTRVKSSEVLTRLAMGK